MSRTKEDTEHPKWYVQKSAFHLVERSCPLCGKTFFCGGEWAYRVRIGHVDHVLCSYTCYRKMQKKKQQVAIYKKR